MSADKYYVYKHVLNGSIVYIGSGCGLRYNSKNGRTIEHLSMWDTLDKIIIEQNLSKFDSIDYENNLIHKHYDTLRFNKRKNAGKVKTICYQDISKLLLYDDLSPTRLRWRVDKSNAKKSGSVAGCLSKNSKYGSIIINGESFGIHRVIYCLKHSIDVSTNLVVDHIDGNTKNNSPDNLRLVTQSDNCKNRTHSGSNCGFQNIRLISKRYEYCVSWTDNCTRKQKSFSFNPKARMGRNTSFHNQEDALVAAIGFRNTLVKSGLIKLTTKEN
jgi:hypothetical protein